MCGIAGIVGTRGTERSRRVAKMAASLQRRGPDQLSFHHDEFLDLAFTRLEIVGGAQGQQPFYSPCGRFVAVVNGEIYNHIELRETAALRDYPFKTTSDCEVVLALFLEKGRSCFNDLNGDFSVVIWDKTTRQLTLAVDRFGIRPMYFSIDQSSGEIIFASVLGALRRGDTRPWTLNWKDVQQRSNRLIDYKGVDTRLPVGLDEVERIQAGLIIEIDTKDFTVRKTSYWEPSRFLDDPMSSKDVGLDDCVIRYRELLMDSVNIRIRGLNDFSVFLSGGLDSGALLAICKLLGKSPVAAGACTQNTMLNGDSISAKRLARHLDLEYLNVEIDLGADIPSCFADVQKHLEVFETFRFNLEACIKGKVYEAVKAARPGIKVNLLGQGADEFSGGYSAARYEGHLSRDWAEYLKHSPVRGWTRAFTTQAAGIPSNYSAMIDERHIRSATSLPTHPYAQECVLRWHWIQVYNLLHEDRNSFEHSMESRVPFFDHRLVEFLLRIPQEYHSALFFDKRIVRCALAPVLPDFYWNRPKIGLVAGVTNEIANGYYRVARRIYPEFREILREKDCPLIMADRTDLMFAELVSDHSDSLPARHILGAVGLQVFSDSFSRPT